MFHKRNQLAIAGSEPFSNFREQSQLVKSLQRKFGKVNIKIEEGFIYYDTMIHENDAHKFN